MNLLRVIASMDPASGGPCQGIRNSTGALNKMGVNVEVASLDDPQAGFIGKDTFTIHALGPAKGPWAYNPRLKAWLLENLPRFDIVVVHGLWLYNGYAVYKALKELRKTAHKLPKLYVMPHGMLDPYFQKEATRKLKAIRNNIYWKLIEGKLVNDADGILFTCQEELELARLSFRPYRPQKELNIGYGIVAPPAESSLSIDRHAYFNGRSFLLFLSRIHHKKGVDFLIKAYQELKRKGHSLPCLLIAGPGLDTPYGKEVMELAAGDKDILFPGMLSGNAKWQAFYTCEAFILPSHQENFGIAVAEALACGKPVLISNQVNIWTEIKNAGAGFVETDDLKGTVHLLEQWISTPEKQKQEAGQAARNLFISRFTVDSATKQMYTAISG
jgi:glycosyltransferase involved in cell wall biosynthesis